MAESTVAVTPGAGKNLHTWSRVIGGTTVEDELVIQGEPYLSTYSVTTNVISTGTANSHLLQIMAGGALNVRIRWIRVYQLAMATAAAMLEWQIFRLTTAGTGGTAYTPAAFEPGDPAAGASPMSLPTVKGTEGATKVWAGTAYMMQTVAASAQFGQPIIDLDFDRPRSKPLIIAAGAANGIALKNVTAVAAGTVYVVALIQESNF